MAVVAVSFTHYETSCRKGDVVDDDHPLVALAPHLFVQPEPEPEPEPDEGSRVREGVVVDESHDELAGPPVEPARPPKPRRPKPRKPRAKAATTKPNK